MAISKPKTVTGICLSFGYRYGHIRIVPVRNAFRIGTQKLVPVPKSLFRYGCNRIGTVCLIQIPVAKRSIGTGLPYRYALPELHTKV
ncbi:hypothetical protein V6N11_082162 [Hibiscus sabdariffa]|uniref:Uncharacterized protein n=1 Tax=Hibiscus sabdariffa TaxID=183260 RepID=A0ABR2QH57_9ROSI